jgi:hypothetical protein
MVHSHWLFKFPPTSSLDRLCPFAHRQGSVTCRGFNFAIQFLQSWFIFQVVIRVRPLNNNEKNTQSFSRCLKQESAHSITWIGYPETRFTFDHVACETIDQVSLYAIWFMMQIVVR